jgi:helix-turn-helix protein
VSPACRISDVSPSRSKPEWGRPIVHFVRYIEVQISSVLLCFPQRAAESGMSRTLDARRHEALRAFLVERRKKAGLRQVDLAKRLGRTQSYVSNIEIGQKRIALIELIEWAEAIGFDPEEAITEIHKVK